MLWMNKFSYYFMQNKKTYMCACFNQAFTKYKQNYKTSYLTILITKQMKLENVPITTTELLSITWLHCLKLNQISFITFNCNCIQHRNSTLEQPFCSSIHIKWNKIKLQVVEDIHWGLLYWELLLLVTVLFKAWHYF